ncbi:sigma-70 family RNA polymerase sigma factor [Streptomyces kaempferi]
MLGSVQDAEDVVQETYARWYAQPEEAQREIGTPLAWLTRVASRICLDHLASARVRRERYTGEWLPEPLRDGTVWTSAGRAGEDDPADRITLDESVGMGVLVVLDTVTPAERVAFVLHDVFGLPFTEIAGTMGRTPAACRQLAASARRRLAHRRSGGYGCTNTGRSSPRSVRRARPVTWMPSSPSSTPRSSRAATEAARCARLCARSSAGTRWRASSSASCARSPGWSSSRRT